MAETRIPNHTPTHEYEYPWPWHQRAVLVELRNEGLERSEIAERLGTTTSTLDYWLAKHELTE